MRYCLIALSVWLISFLPAPAETEGGPAGYWKLDDDGRRPLVTDASGSQRHGRLDDDGDHFVPGRVGQAVRFPLDGALRLDRHAAIFGKLENFTLSMWIQYDGGASRQLFTFSDGSLKHRIQVEVHDDRLHFGWHNGAAFTGFGTEELEWTPGTWYHVVFVNDTASGKSILRSNDLARATHSNTLGPAGLNLPVQRVEIGSLNGEYRFHGCIDEVRLFDAALPLSEQFALYASLQDAPADAQWKAAKAAMLARETAQQIAGEVRRVFQDEAAPRLTSAQRQRKADWLFQAQDDDLLTRAGKELAWTRAMIDRLQRAGAADFSGELARLAQLEQKAATVGAAPAPADLLTLYFDIRALKRRVMFQRPEVDFSAVVCVDAPYPWRSPETHGTRQQHEWVHESRFRSEMGASHGAKLVVLDDIAGTATPRELAPPDSFGQPVAMFNFDLSFDGGRVLFCMKPENEKAFHLYEIGLDGSGFRQVTAGGYSDIDPIYLPDGRYLFLSTRADVYAQCGMWARSHILTRCDPDGSNIYMLSPGTEPEFSPALLDDGRVLFTRWEYVDKFANRIQSLWTMRPDGTAAATFWGNQSVRPDHLGEARHIPGSGRVMFTGFGHHDVWVGCIGVVDPREGLNFPDGIWKITQELPWPEVGDGPAATPGLTAPYHTSGEYAAYKSPYPLSDELFLVSARTGARDEGRFMHSAHDPTLGKFKLYLMDVHGNRELIYEGDENVLYARPVRPRTVPPVLPDVGDMPGPEGDNPIVWPGLFFSADIFHNAPPVLREHGRYLRVVESMPKNYSTGIVHSGGKPFGTDGPNTAWGVWGERFLPGKSPTPATDISWGDHTQFHGPATTLTGPLGVKQVHGTVPIRDDGSVCFEAPPCRMLYFQVLDEHHRAVHTMRSWVSVRPGEQRGCTGCHEGHTAAPALRPLAARAVPDPVEPPAWGIRSLSFVGDIQPIFDRACAACHQGEGPATGALDLTLRPDPLGAGRWGGIFAEPYLTLVLGKGHERVGGACPPFDGRGGYVAVPNTITTRYDTLPPLAHLSPRSLLVGRAMDVEQCGRDLAAQDLRMLIAWIDLWAMYRSDEECRAIDDPPAEWFPLWSSPPRLRTAPRVRTEYAQDDYTCPDVRAAGQRPRGPEDRRGSS